MIEQVLFWGFATLVTICSLCVVTLKNPVSSAAFLILDLFLLAGIYAMQGADFIAAIQLIVYTGAIVVLFLFVVMILNLESEGPRAWRQGPIESLALAFVVSGLVFLSYHIFALKTSDPVSYFTQVDNTREVASVLFYKYVWPFEIVSILILLAIVGSVAIAKRRQR